MLSSRIDKLESELKLNDKQNESFENKPQTSSTFSDSKFSQ